MTLLSPSSVAIIGASSTPGKVGHDVLKNIIEQGYQGDVYPINPKGGEILGKAAYESMSAVPGEVDLAVIAIPAKFVPAVVQECADKNVQTVVIISAGFSEVHTEEGKALEEEVKTIIEKSGMNLVGPNCLGILRPSLQLNASFAKDLPAEGSVALVSQSGAMAVAIMDSAPQYHLGFSVVASIGNKATMDECDWLEVLADDDETKVIGLYLESITEGRRFLEVAGTVSQKKPIVLLKSGVSASGSKAANSHTGALAGSDAAIDAACQQAGIHRAHTMADLFDLVRVLSTQPTLATNRIAVITNAGGPGILATDAAEKAGLIMPSFQGRTLDAMKDALPAAASTGNPIDVVGDADAARYQAAIDACCDDSNIDGLCVLLTPQVMTPCEEIADIIAAAAKTHPLMPITTSFMGSDSVGPARAKLREANIPTFETPERAINALAALAMPGVETSRRDVSAKESPHCSAAQKLLEGHEGLVPEGAAKELFALYGLELPEQALATSADEAVKIANVIGYPVVAKISSPDVLHKTDVGGIKVNLENDDEVRKAYDDIMNAAPKAIINGVLIQQFLPIGSEFIIGALRDPNFGPLVMVGLGGIYTELFKDTTFRIAPITEEESYEMLQELTAWKLLKGMRGKPPAAIDDLAHIVHTISQLVHDCPHITELDINPAIAGEKKVVIADVKIVKNTLQ